jgi:hypothetical protein
VSSFNSHNVAFLQVNKIDISDFEIRADMEDAEKFKDMKSEEANAECKKTMIAVNEMISKVSSFPGQTKKYLSPTIGCGRDAFFSDVLFKKNNYYTISRTLILSFFCS